MAGVERARLKFVFEENDRSELDFRIGMHSYMRHPIAAYEERFGIPHKMLRFRHGWDGIGVDETPMTLGLVSDNQGGVNVIEVRWRDCYEEEEDGDDTIGHWARPLFPYTIVGKDPNDQKVTLHARGKAQLVGELNAAFVEKAPGVNYTLRFHYRGDGDEEILIKYSDTPESLNMEIDGRDDGKENHVLVFYDEDRDF